MTIFTSSLRRCFFDVMMFAGVVMNRKHLVHVRVSPDERQQLDEEAARRGVSREAILRAGIVLVSGRMPEPRAGVLPDPKPTGSPDRVPAA